MGKNGSGKSTLAKVLVGHPEYNVIDGEVLFKGQNLLELEPEERSHLGHPCFLILFDVVGLFLSFQSPIAIPGVNNVDFLRMAYNAQKRAKNEPELDPLEFYGFLSPKVNATTHLFPKGD